MSHVDCPLHGPQQQTFVCQHVAHGLVDRHRVGFCWPEGEPEASRPDAWCSDCNDRLRRTNWEWRGEALDQLGAQVLCGVCYDGAKLFHMGGPFTLPDR